MAVTVSDRLQTVGRGRDREGLMPAIAGRGRDHQGSNPVSRPSGTFSNYMQCVKLRMGRCPLTNRRR